MHRCLSIPEILTHICDQLIVTDMLSIALTCKTLKPVALESLWQELPDLSPMVRLLPRDAWKVKKERRPMRMPGCGDLVLHTYDLNRGLTPTDWKVALKYLPKIRSIGLRYFSFLRMVQLSERLFQGILDSAPQVLFPNLQRFELPAADSCPNYMLVFIKSILGQHFEYLGFNITLQASPSVQTSLLRSIPTTCPGLRSFDLGYKSLYIPAISEVICQFRLLEEIKVPSLSKKALIHVSQLSYLRELALSNVKATEISSFPAIPAPAFPALTTLDIRRAPASFHASMHTVITSPRFAEYVGQFEEPAQAKEWKEIFTRLAETRSTITSISFEWEKQPRNPLDPAYLITPDVFRPVLSFKNLTMLSLGFVLTFDFDDAFVLELAKACTQLDFVVLGSDWGSGRRSRATMLSFVHLLRHCPRLGCIGLVVDASRIDQELLNSSRNLKHLANADLDFTFSVGDSYIEDPFAVAKFLSTLVDPDAKDDVSVHTANDCPLDIREKWRIVQHMLPVCVSTRILKNKKSKFEVSRVIEGDDDEEGEWTDVSDDEE